MLPVKVNQGHRRPPGSEFLLMFSDLFNAT